MSRDWVHLTWSEKTWSERAQTVFANTIAFGFGFLLLICALYVFGQIIDAQDERRTEYRRCMQNATNGLEIERCKGL